MALLASTWLDVMASEYFNDYIRAGGGAVRFVVAEAPVLDVLMRDLSERAAASELFVVPTDLAVVRLHMLQNIVFVVAAALPWEVLLQTRLEALVGSAGYQWPAPGLSLRLTELAEANGVAPHLFRRDMTQVLSREIWRDSKLTQDFRHAMIALMEHRLTGETQALAESVMGWLCGTLTTVAPLKSAQIARRIGRQNARGVLVSLCHWVRQCGGAGVLLLLDIRQLHRDRRSVGEGLFYTPSAVMDCYEVLRQLIDDAEHFAGLFVAALADDSLLSDDPRRSLGQYTALQMRVWDDVRPGGGANALAPLVRLTS